MTTDSAAWFDFFGPDYDDESPLIWAQNIAEEYRIGGMPAFTALFHRTFPTYTESMWIQGYPVIRSIVVTHLAVAGLPGCVRTLPVGFRDMATADTLRAKFERVCDLYAGEGWTRKPHTLGASS